jgi:hypothetical protein
MALLWITLVLGVFNICVGFALGVYVQTKRQAASGTPGMDEGVPLDDGFAPYRSLARASGDAGEAVGSPKQGEA